MAYDIIHKNSTVAGTPPTASEIELGEIAINAADAELYTKDTDGAVNTFSNNATIATKAAFTQSGTGAVQRTVAAKLQDVVSVKDFGAVGDGGTDDTAAIQAAVTAAKHVVFPSGAYSINDAITISQAGATIEGLGDVEIFQQAYPQHVFFVEASGCTFDNLKMTGVPNKSLLSEALSSRYYGDVLRAKSSAIYVLGSDNVNIRSCQFKKFVTGIFLKGGDDISWVTNDGSADRMTATTFVLSAADQKTNDYWNDGYIRILTSNGSHGFARIADYDSASNTVTFTTATTPIALTGSTQWNYILVKGRSKNITVRDCYFDAIDFGINGENTENLTIEDCVFESIEQTQQTNARPHSIYLTGGDNRNTRAASLMTHSCPNGQAYKFLAVDGLFLSDLDSFNSRGTATIEACRNVTGNNLSVVLSGSSNAFQPGIVDITASEKVFLNGLRLSIDESYAQTAANLRPFGVSVIGSDDIGRGDLGTMLSASPIQTADVHITNAAINGGIYTGTINAARVLGTATRSVINLNLENFSLINGAAANYTAIRADYCDNVNFRYCSYTELPATALVQFDGNCANSTAVLNPDQSNFSFVDTGTSNRLVYTAPFTKGTWTPTLVGSVTAGSNTYASQLGDWMKLGDMVYVTGRITLSNLDSTGNLTIAGLPYPSDNFDASSGATYFQGGGLGDYNNVNFASTPMLRMPRNSTAVRLSYQGTTGVSEVTHAELTNTTNLTFSFSYKAAP